MNFFPKIAALIFVLSIFTGSSAQEVTKEFITTSMVEGERTIKLELFIAKPQGSGPFPVLIFNHGSTGRGDKPELFGQSWSSPAISKYFTDRGWMVIFPQRRGRGGSDGLYDEGFEPDRSRYSCLIDLSLSGVKRALEDLDAVTEHVRARPDVSPNRMLIGGQSRGGILAIAYAGHQPNIFLGVINFAGGWIAEACENATTINGIISRRGSNFKRPTLWLYGERDPFYSISHSKKYYDSFIKSGGTGKFHSYIVPGLASGHTLISYPELWGGLLDSYLAELKEQ